MGDRLEFARDLASRHMVQIQRQRDLRARLELIVRRDNEPEMDFLLTDDNLDEVSKAIDRAKGRPDV